MNIRKVDEVMYVICDCPLDFRKYSSCRAESKETDFSDALELTSCHFSRTVYSLCVRLSTFSPIALFSAQIYLFRSHFFLSRVNGRRSKKCKKIEPYKIDGGKFTKERSRKQIELCLFSVKTFFYLKHHLCFSF